MYGIKRLCRVLNVSRSGFYAWLAGATGRAARAIQEERLVEQIRKIHTDTHATYGSPDHRGAARAGPHREPPAGGAAHAPARTRRAPPASPARHHPPRSCRAGRPGPAGPRPAPPPGLTPDGSATSPTCGSPTASCTWRPWWTCTRAAWWAGRWPPTPALSWPATRCRRRLSPVAGTWEA